MTLWSSPHPKESAALSLGQVQQNTEVVKIKELADSSASVMPSSATSLASDGSEDAGFEDGSIDVHMGEEETEDGIQIDCIQTLTEFDPILDGELRGNNDDSPLMSDCKTPIPLPPPPVHVGSGAYGGNQAYVNLQTALPRIIERSSSPMQAFWGSSSTHESTVHPSRTPGDVGLCNIGNTCFMNSGLQCLVHTSPLVEFFLASNSFERTATSLIYQFNSLMNHIWFGDKGAISLHDFKLVLGNKYGQFKDCRQHDCQEFLAVLLDMLHEELKLGKKAVASIVDSSVAESFIEDCTVSEKSQTNDDQCNSDDSVTQSSEIVTTEKSPVCKRLKLEKEECDTGPADTPNINSTKSNDVKRKSPSSKTVNCDKSTNPKTDLNEEQLDVKKKNADNEARGSGCSNHEPNIDQSPQMSPVQKAQESWNKYIKENDTVIASTFQGMLKSAVTCSECSFNSETYEPFMYLSLPIPRVMEKQLNVTFISMKHQNCVRVEITLHLMGTVGTLIQEVFRKMDDSVFDSNSKYVAAEVFNHRVSRVLDDKLQPRNLSTNSRNIYVYELNDNFDDKYNGNDIISDTPPKLEKEKWCIGSASGDVEQVKKEATVKEWICDDSIGIERPSLDASPSTSSMPTYSPMGAPVGGGLYDVASSSTAHGVTSTSDAATELPMDNDNFNRVQCNICLEDYPRSEVKKHRSCSCVLCEECLLKSAEHFQAEGGKIQEGFVKCAVCLQTVECKKAFVSLDESTTLSSSSEFITMSVLFRNEPGIDANNNSSWSPGLFGYPWLIRVPSFLNAAELVEYIESINPAPEVNHRLLSVKSDGKNCGQCVFSARCNGCEIPKEGMISVNSCNSILISFIDLPSEQIAAMQPADMIVQNELSSSSLQYNRNDEPTIDIHDCLRTFSETEHLDEQNPWFCPQCAKNQRATKALSICKFPDYLIVYLKRFVFLDQSSNKLNNRLTFPINDLDISDYVTEGFGDNVGKYNLYSCVCHFGSASAGHYTAYAKNPVTSKWHYFNDDSIVERAPGDNEYASAYVLFYEKQGMDCNIPAKCNRPLPELNSFKAASSAFTADTRGSYLPGESSVSAGPVRVEDDFIGEINLQVDSTSPNFTYPHPSTEQDLMGLDVDEGVVDTEATHLEEIRDGLGLPENDTVVVSSSTTGAEEDGLNADAGHNYDSCGDDDISTSTQDHELLSCSGGGADSTSN